MRTRSWDQSVPKRKQERDEKETGRGPYNNGLVYGGNMCVIESGSFVQGKLYVVVYLKCDATQLMLGASTRVIDKRIRVIDIFCAKIDVVTFVDDVYAP